MLLVLGLFALGNIEGMCTDNFAVALAARVLPAFCIRCTVLWRFLLPVLPCRKKTG